MAPDEPSKARVPPPRGAVYYLGKHLAHRLQAARALRSNGDWSSPDGVRILAYHRVIEDRDELAVSPAVFRRQMEAVVASGAKLASLDDGLDALERALPGRRVCVTFDDAYRDNLENAIPVLRELCIPATIFAPTAVIDGRARLYWYERQPPVLGWPELREIDRDPLFSIGAHTRTHPALPQLSDEAARSEIEGSKRDLEDRLSRAVTSFAYPAGLWGERELQIVRDAGYRLAVTTDPGLNRPGRGHRPEALYRSFIDRRDTPAMFQAKLTGLLDRPWAFEDLTMTRLAGRRVVHG